MLDSFVHEYWQCLVDMARDIHVGSKSNQYQA